MLTTLISLIFSYSMVLGQEDQNELLRSDVVNNEYVFDEFAYGCLYTDFNFTPPIILTTHRIYILHACVDNVEKVLHRTTIYPMKSKNDRILFGDYLPNRTVPFEEDIDIWHLKNLNFDMWKESNLPIYIGSFYQQRYQGVMHNIFTPSAKATYENDTILLTQIHPSRRNIKTYEYLFHKIIPLNEITDLSQSLVF